jgi:hypothetical protein
LKAKGGSQGELEAEGNVGLGGVGRRAGGRVPGPIFLESTVNS